MFNLVLCSDTEKNTLKLWMTPRFVTQQVQSQSRAGVKVRKCRGLKQAPVRGQVRKSKSKIAEELI